MKRFVKKNARFLFILSGVITFSTLLSGCGKKAEIPLWIGNFYQEMTISTGALNKDNTYVWYTHPAKETVLSSEMGGRIIKIAVDLWKKVKKGNMLALVDTNEMDVNYQAANTSLNAFNQLSSATESTFDSQIAMAENKVKQAKIAVDLASIDDNWSAEKALKQIEIQIDTLKTQLERAKSSLGTTEHQLYENGENMLLASKILLVNIGDFSDELLGISTAKQHLNDSFEVYLSAKDTNLKTKAKDQWRNLNADYQELIKNVDAIENFSATTTWDQKSTTTQESKRKLIYQALKQDVALLKKVRTLLKTLYDVVDNSVDGVSLPMQKLTTWKQSITKMQWELEKLLLDADAGTMMGVQWILQNIDNFGEGETTQITLLKKQITLAEQQYLTMKDQSGKKYEIAQEQYKEAQNAIAMLKAQKQSQLAQINTQKTASLAQKNSALVQKKNATIVAPFDAVILKKHVEIWQLVGPWTPIVSVGSENIYQVSFSIPVKQSTAYSLGQEVKLSIVDIDSIFSGKISAISPIADRMSKKILIKVDFSSEGKEIPFGAYTQIKISNKEYQGIEIPLSYIQYHYGSAFVFVKENLKDNLKDKKQWNTTKYNKKEITLSYCSDESCIVKSWLSLGETIVKKLK